MMAFVLDQEAEAGWEAACYQAYEAWDSWALAYFEIPETLAGSAFEAFPATACGFGGVGVFPMNI